jgi:hypothetical protein
MRSDPTLKEEVSVLLDRCGCEVQAGDANELRERLGVDDTPGRFKRALKSLMYKDKCVIRRHIDGERYFVLIKPFFSEVV